MFKGPTSKEREGKGRGGGKRREVKGGGERLYATLSQIPGYTTGDLKRSHGRAWEQLPPICSLPHPRPKKTISNKNQFKRYQSINQFI